MVEATMVMKISVGTPQEPASNVFNSCVRGVVLAPRFRSEGGEAYETASTSRSDPRDSGADLGRCRRGCRHRHESHRRQPAGTVLAEQAERARGRRQPGG